MKRQRDYRMFPQLHRDAPNVPDGLQPSPGVEYGCGISTCRDCYMPVQDGRNLMPRDTDYPTEED